MDFVFDVLKFGVSWYAGVLLSNPAMQILICVFCSFPMIRKLKPYANCFDLADCKRFYWGAILINGAILGLAVWAVIRFAPQPMMTGFFCGLGFTLLMGLGKFGCTETNVSEFIQTLQKFVLPGKDDEAFLAIMEALGIKQ